MKEVLLASEPQTFFTTPLVRASKRMAAEFLQKRR